MTKVVDFNKRLEKKKEIEALEKELKEIDEDTYFAMTFGVDVAHDIVEVLSDFGYDVGEDPKTILDILMIIESCHSMIMRCAGKEYTFQEIAEKLFRNEDGDPLDYENLLSEFIEDKIPEA